MTRRDVFGHPCGYPALECRSKSDGHRNGGGRVTHSGFWILVRKRWFVIAALSLLGVVIGSAYVVVTPPEYTAKTELFVSTVSGDNTADLAQGSNFAQQQARNYSIVAQRDIVLVPVITALGLKTTPDELSDRISASVPLNSSMISISVTDSSPARAAATADAVGTSLANTVIRLVPKRSDGSSPVNLQVVQPARVPTSPSAPNPRVVLAFAGILGLLAGLGFTAIAELISAKVRSVDHLKEITNLTILGTVSDDKAAVTSPLFSQSNSQSLRSEEYRQIRTNVHFLHPDESHKVFVVTSSIPGEGKSTTSANLAVTLAASGIATCLVEADLRKPALGDYLDLEGGVGLTTILAGDATLDEALQSWGPHQLQVLLSGQVPPNPSELLESNQAQNLLRTLKARFDVVIIDCPPLMPVTDAAVVARAFGGAILVVGVDRVETRELKMAMDALTTSGAPILGVIANFVPAGTRGRYQTYGQTSGHAQSERRTRKPEHRTKDREVVPSLPG
ncbi:polysaccharide biosynthesis tyrosine autokinase [Cryobacterium cryoconiti]|nr:polysaccharide biosynthesis tyrosine autokinase [Cryobacterium cryoconiti]